MYVTARVIMSYFKKRKFEYSFDEESHSSLESAEEAAKSVAEHYRTTCKVFKLEEVCEYSISPAVRNPPKE